MSMFKTIVNDVFKGLPEVPAQMFTSAAGLRTPDVEAALLSATEDSGLVPHKPWVDKCIQFHGIAQVHQGTTCFSLYQNLLV